VGQQSSKLLEAGGGGPTSGCTPWRACLRKAAIAAVNVTVVAAAACLVASSLRVCRVERSRVEPRSAVPPCRMPV
jgi:hypothetical protein